MTTREPLPLRILGAAAVGCVYVVAAVFGGLAYAFGDKFMREEIAKQVESRR